MSFDPGYVLRTAMKNIDGIDSDISNRCRLKEQLQGLRKFVTDEMPDQPVFSKTELTALTTGTNEHQVFEDKKRGLAIKLTKPNEYGHSIINGTHRATPFEYLRRLSDHNKYLGGNYSFLNITETQQLVVAQKWYQFDDSRLTEQDIDDRFRTFGFVRSKNRPEGYGGGLYFNPNPDIHLVVVDANDKNVLRKKEW